MNSKKYLPTFFLFLTALTTGWGQTTQSVVAMSGQARLPDIMISILIASVVVLIAVGLLVIIRSYSVLTKQIVRLEAEKHGIILPEDTADALNQPAGDDFFTRMRKKYWENPVPPEREGDITLHHDYDGIRELDNHLPPWWVNMFVLCILWSVGYMWYYHWGGNGPNQTEEYKMEVESAKKDIAMALAGKANAVDESNVVALTETGALNEGELIFKGNCTACHGQKGEGTVGPNLTDAHWLHGGGIAGIFKSIKYGIPEKGMIAWQAQLKPADIQKVTSYILTLKGTNPPNPKAPQGNIWKEESVDSLTTPKVLSER